MRLLAILFILILTSAQPGFADPRARADALADFINTYSSFKPRPYTRVDFPLEVPPLYNYRGNALETPRAILVEAGGLYRIYHVLVYGSAVDNGEPGLKISNAGVVGHIRSDQIIGYTYFPLDTDLSQIKGKSEGGVCSLPREY